jgi:hypothetical protein
MNLPLTKARLGIAAGALGAAGALTFVAAAAGAPADSTADFRNASSSDNSPGDISGPCDEAEHANDPQCVTVTAPATPTTAAPAPGGSTTGAHSLPTPGGTVAYNSNGSTLTLVSAMPANGWRVEVEQRTGREIELDFRSGSRRVQVNVEIEDGQVRERVRVRDDDGTDVRIENGVVVDDRGNTGNAGDDDGPGHDVGDDHGVDGAGHDVGDDHGVDGAGHDVGDDHGGASGSSGSGSDDSGSGSSGSGSSGSGSSHSGGSDDSGSSGGRG